MPHASNWYYSGRVPQRMGSSHPNIAPYDRYTAADGELFLGVVNDGQFRRFCAQIARPELATDPRYLTKEDRVARRAEVDAMVADWTRQYTKQELTELLGGEIPFGPVFSAADIFANPHFRARGMLVETEQPGATQPLTLAGTPVRMQGTPGGVHRRAPLTGEHSESTLADLGFDADEIAALRADGALG